MIHERRTGKDLEGNGHSLIEVLSWHFPAGSEEKYEKPQLVYPAFQLKFELNAS
jgi:hypothetical protein